MNRNQIEENWSTLCRKLPLVATLNVADLDDAKLACVNYCHHFDHVVLLMNDNFTESSKLELQNFVKSERIINLSITDVKDGESFIEKASLICENNFLNSLCVFMNENVGNNHDFRWKMYDLIKEMKSPMTDRILLNSNLSYCLNDPTVTIFWSHS